MDEKIRRGGARKTCRVLQSRELPKGRGKADERRPTRTINGAVGDGEVEVYRHKRNRASSYSGVCG